MGVWKVEDNSLRFFHVTKAWCGSDAAGCRPQYPDCERKRPTISSFHTCGQDQKEAVSVAWNSQ